MFSSSLQSTYRSRKILPSLTGQIGLLIFSKDIEDMEVIVLREEIPNTDMQP